MSDPQGPPDPAAQDPEPDPKTLSLAAALMAVEEDWTVFRRFDEFNLLNLLMLQDEIQKLTKEFKESCPERSDNGAAADSAWYTPSYPLASRNRIAAQVEAEEGTEERRRQLWTQLREKLKEYSECSSLHGHV